MKKWGLNRPCYFDFFLTFFQNKGTMARGGRRPGSGRKKKEVKKTRIQTLDPLKDKAHKALEKGLDECAPWAIKLWFQYYYGMPVPVQPDQEANNIVINVMVDDNADPASEIAKQIIAQTDE